MCFDGGGVRGLLTCQLMIELERKLKRPLWDVFDFFAGTSTGSLIAIWCANRGRLDILRGIYFFLKDTLFAGYKPYDVRILENVIKV